MATKKQVQDFNNAHSDPEFRTSDKPKRTRKTVEYLNKETRQIVQQLAREDGLSEKNIVDLALAQYCYQERYTPEVAKTIVAQGATFETLGMKKTRNSKAYKAENEALKARIAELEKALDVKLNS